MNDLRKNEGIMEALGRIHASIAVLGVKLDGLTESNDKEHRAIDLHLTTLNGQVAKNTRFRWQTIAYIPVAIIFISSIVALVFNKFL